LKQRKFPAEHEEELHTSSLWVMEKWNTLPREVVESPLWRYSGSSWTRSCAACCR